MLRIMSEKLWSLMKEKDVSLVMIFDDEGKILWSRGREVRGKARDVNASYGFSRTVVKETLKQKREVFQKKGSYIVSEDILSGTAVNLGLKSVLTLPISKKMFVYFDSKGKVFNKGDIEYLRGMVEIFGCAIEDLKQREIPAVFFNNREMQDVREKVIKYAMENESVLITGETGVGKSFIAREIHRLSERYGKFIEFNCSNFPSELFESELFGHKKGSFTGAFYNKKGIVEEANKGTLFFDEVAEIPLALQPKLLRFVETKRYRMIGSEREKTSDVRMIFATNRELEKQVLAGKFREDLYYRISTFIIHLPPLRERKGMIEYLIEHYSFLLNGKKLKNSAKDILINHKWSGNIREFIQVFKRAGIELSSDEIGEEIKNCMKNHLNGKKHGEIINYNKEEEGVVKKAIHELLSGKNFWQAIKEPFMARDLTRENIAMILKTLLLKAKTNKIKDIISNLNIQESEYRKLLDFLSNHKIKV
jgi:transcriptional regulator with PAS, ATPase and Fis domain